MSEKSTIVVWFSCGAASAVAAKKTIETYGGRYLIRVVNNPIKEEDEDNLRFLVDVQNWLGVKIEKNFNTSYPNFSAKEVWADRKYMSGIKGAPCTYELKKKARQQWESKNSFDYLVLGFTLEEKHRYERFKQNERENILPVLIDHKITKQDCFSILKNEGLALPRIYSLGYPNANCIGCVKATSPTYWNLVRQKHLDVFNDRANQSRELNAKLVRYKGKRVFLDELNPSAKGRSIKNYNFECGIYCEEK